MTAKSSTVSTCRIDWPKARRQEKIEEYQSKICRGIGRGMTSEGIVSILDGAKILPKKGKLNRASQWWTRPQS